MDGVRFFHVTRRCIRIAKANSGPLINDEIRFPKVRLIESDGSMVGIVPIQEARKRAEDQNLDLVLISAQPDNPVCRIMDYNKFKFEQAKKEKEAKKNQKITEVKEIGLKLTIEEHDLSYKTKNACRFLEDGDRVKVVIKFRGREMTYTNRGYELMRQFAQACAAVGQVDREPRIEGRNMVMFLAPLKK